MAKEVAIVVNEAAMMAKKTSEAPHKVADITGKATRMVEIGYDTIMTMDQAASRVHDALSEASNNHSRNVEEVTSLFVRMGKCSRRFRLKVMMAIYIWP